MVKQPYQGEVGGPTPTPPLQVFECELSVIQTLIERQHDSHSVFGVTKEFCFGVHRGLEVVGAAIFGNPAGMGVLKKYSEDGKFRTTELRRFVLTDECPRNSESRLLAVMLRMLKKRGVQRVLSYADPSEGHTGVIYKATGFNLLGQTSKRKHVMWKGKKYPDRNIHQTHFPYHQELRQALETGEASRVEVQGKFIYVKDLN